MICKTVAALCANILNSEIQHIIAAKTVEQLNKCSTALALR